MADSGHIHNEFSPICAPQNVEGESMKQSDIYHQTQMSHLSHEQYRNNTVTRTGNFHQNAQMPYSQSVLNQSTTSDNNEWNQTVSNECTIPNHDIYQNVPNPESTTSGYNPCRIVPDRSTCQRIPGQSSTLSYIAHQHVKPHEVINTPEIQNDVKTTGQRVLSTTLSIEVRNARLMDWIIQRRNVRYTPEQTAILESAFERNNYLDYDTKRQLAKAVQLEEYKISDWFRNRRMKSLMKYAEK